MNVIQQKYCRCYYTQNNHQLHANNNWKTWLQNLQRISTFHYKHWLTRKPELDWKLMSSQMFSKVFVTTTLQVHYVRGACIWSFSSPYFPVFGLNTEYSVSHRIHSECEKIRTRKTPNTDTFYAVNITLL